jgi:hypothetical protein
LEAAAGSCSPAAAIRATLSIAAIVPGLHIDHGGSFVELLGPDPKLLSCCLGAGTKHQFAHPPRKTSQEFCFHEVPGPPTRTSTSKNFGVLAQARHAKVGEIYRVARVL